MQDIVLTNASGAHGLDAMTRPRRSPSSDSSDDDLDDLAALHSGLTVLLADWDLATEWSPDVFQTKSCGSPHYASPSYVSGK
jgi:hypothetical protein